MTKNKNEIEEKIETCIKLLLDENLILKECCKYYIFFSSVISSDTIGTCMYNMNSIEEIKYCEKREELKIRWKI